MKKRASNQTWKFTVPVDQRHIMRTTTNPCHHILVTKDLRSLTI
ncbi:hypothetical protein LINGRAHAP2_LOCUS11472 [Linum grandiflorum]